MNGPLDGMSGLAQQKKQAAAADGGTSGSAKGTSSRSTKGSTSKLSKFAKEASSGLPKGVTSGSAKGTTSAKAATSGSAEEVTDEESKPGSCILTQFTPLQLVAKRPGHKIPTVIWESKLKHSSRSVRPLRRFH